MGARSTRDDISHGEKGWKIRNVYTSVTNIHLNTDNGYSYIMRIVCASRAPFKSLYTHDDNIRDNKRVRYALAERAGAYKVLQSEKKKVEEKERRTKKKDVNYKASLWVQYTRMTVFRPTLGTIN